LIGITQTINGVTTATSPQEIWLEKILKFIFRPVVPELFEPTLVHIIKHICV